MKAEAPPLQPAPPLPATSRPKFESPATAVFCWIIGWFALIVGLVMVFAAFATAFGLSHPNDTGGDFLPFAVAVCLRSIFWFALAKIVEALTEIAHHTRRSHVIPAK